MTECRLITQQSEWERLIPDWDDLAAAAAEPNPFYESWFLLPACRHLAPAGGIKILTLWQDSQLLALLPMERTWGGRRRPLPQLQNWLHLHCFLGTPLIRSGYETEAAAELLGRLDSEGKGASGTVLGKINADGPVARALHQSAATTKRSVICLDSYQRRVLDSPLSAADYMQQVLRPKHLKDLRRKEAALTEGGALSYKCLDACASLSYLEEFLKLEAAGWKGTAGTALLCRPAEAAFFRELLAAGARQEKIVFHGLELNQRLIAGRFSFLNGAELFGFKTAFDESLGRNSPGLLLEIELIKGALSSQPRLVVDSCAAPGAELFHRIYNAEKAISTLFLSRKGYWGSFVAAGVSRWSAAKRKLRAIRLNHC